MADQGLVMVPITKPATLCACYHNLLMVLCATPISSAIMVSEPNRNMSKSKGWTLQSSLLMLWMEKTQVNNQTKIAGQKNLQIQEPQGAAGLLTGKRNNKKEKTHE